MNEEEKKELRRLDEAATPGPWAVVEKEGYYYFVPPGDHRMGLRSKENALFIAAARDALPRLLDEVGRLEQAFKRLEKKMEGLNPKPIYNCNCCGDQFYQDLEQCPVCGGEIVERGRANEI